MSLHARPLVALSLLALSLLPSACGSKLNPGEVEDAVTPSSGTTGGDTTTPTGSTGTTTGNTGTTGTTPSTGTSAKLCGTDSTTIGYAANVQAVVSKSCASSSCHGGGRSPKMTDFTSTKAGISGGGKDEVNSGSMPLGSTLSPNDKCIILKWADGNYAP